MIEKDLDLLEAGDMNTESMQVIRALKPWTEGRYRPSDKGMANLFADFFGDRARFMEQQNCWYVYDGKVWRKDHGDLTVRTLIKALSEFLHHYAKEITDPLQREVAIAQAARWQTHRARMVILNDAQDVYPLTPDMLDDKPMYLNCRNGTLDMETGVLHPHAAYDMQSRICGADYVPGVRCERWEQFVLEVMRHSSGQGTLDSETEARAKVKWLQRMMGYALTGDTSRECMFMLYGQSTRNGKSTLMETMLRLMGDYGLAMRPESLALRSDGRSASGPTEDIARLQGVRLVSVSEPDRHMKLSVSLVKTLTGNDTITARNLYQNSFQFHPQFKLFFNTNHLPEAGDDTLFTSGRVHLVPFERHFEPHEQDTKLKWLFSQPICLTGILNWCLEGLAAMRADGFSFGPMPESARQCLADYSAENDAVGQFVQECLTPAEGKAVKSADVYSAYVRWCAHNGVEREKALTFRKGLKRYYQLGRFKFSGATTNAVFDCQLQNN